MQIGYKVINRRRITGASVLNKIKYSKLRVIGAGANGLVMTDGKYAIKVGMLYEGDYDNLTAAAKHGFAVPVVYFEERIKIDQRLMNFIESSTFYRNGWEVDVSDYFTAAGYADMMISMLAQPYLDNNCEVDGDDRQAAYAVAYEVQSAYQRKVNGHWGDVHPWNLGIYRGAIVILDF